MYIYQLPNWPNFSWDRERLNQPLAAVSRQQGRLLGRVEGFNPKLRSEANLQTLTEEVIKSSEIEGEKLNRNQVRSSIARRLKIDIGTHIRADRNVDGVVSMIVDATAEYAKPLTNERLFAWHKHLFPNGYSGLKQITTGAWRPAEAGPMQVVSMKGHYEKVHFEAPHARVLEKEMQAFLKWFNKSPPDLDPLLKAGIAHLWFVTIHPFEDGNGRIGRAIADMALARSEKTAQRFYSISAQIWKERDKYYDYLEDTQKGDLDISDHLEWFLDCLGRALEGATTILEDVFRKARFWDRHAGESFNDRQRKIIFMLLDGFEGKLTSSKWAAIAKCSQDTASRDIDDLIKRRILVKDKAGGRSTSYSLVLVSDQASTG